MFSLYNEPIAYAYDNCWSLTVVGHYDNCHGKMIRHCNYVLSLALV